MTQQTAPRPTLSYLPPPLTERIIDEARDLLCRLGVTILDADTCRLLADHGAQIEGKNEKTNVRFTGQLLDNALKSIRRSFKLYDIHGRETHDFSGYNVHFTPGSSALNIWDMDADRDREPMTADYIRYVKTVNGLPHLASQSTAFVPADVSEKISDSYRLYLGLRFGHKPVITGTFGEGGFDVMQELLTAVRGTPQSLREKPLAVFSCCSTTPLKWGRDTCRVMAACGRAGIPVELISMPLCGSTGPVTLVGTLVGHTAENLCGIAISQCVAPGAPLLYGTAAAPFDMRTGTTPLGAVESQMMACATNEIGKYLGLPTQAYTALSDAPRPDAQAGLETSMGAATAALAGINNISGPGMLSYVNCFSTEKLVLDNEICGMAKRMIKGMAPREDFPIIPRYRELLEKEHLLGSAHTLKYFRDEHYFPGPVIHRAPQAGDGQGNGPTLVQRAQAEILKLLKNYRPPHPDPTTEKQLTDIMTARARQHGMDHLPVTDN